MTSSSRASSLSSVEPMVDLKHARALFKQRRKKHNKKSKRGDDDSDDPGPNLMKQMLLQLQQTSGQGDLGINDGAKQQLKEMKNQMNMMMTQMQMMKNAQTIAAGSVAGNLQVPVALVTPP
eukprot:1817307-Pyramimonas_sp.AAC.1